MTPKTMYIERKTRDGIFLNDKGPAIIGEVTFSKSGRTIYYKGMAFRRATKGLTYGNFYDYDEDSLHNDEFWITGVKKRGSNRMPWAEGQPVIENGDLK